MGRPREISNKELINVVSQWPKDGVLPSTGDIQREIKRDSQLDAEYDRKTVYRRLEQLATNNKLGKIQVGSGRGNSVAWFVPGYLDRCDLGLTSRRPSSGSGRSRKVTAEDLVTLLKETDKRVLDPKRMAEEFGVSNQTIRNYTEKLQAHEDVQWMDVGRVTVYWHSDDVDVEGE